MNIVIDANILISNFMLQSRDFTLFFRNFKSAGFNCWVPEISVKETVSIYKDQLFQKIVSYNKSVNKINRQSYTISKTKINEDIISDDVEAYENYLRHTLEFYGVAVIEHPKVNHSKILDQLFGRKFPFDSKDNGYKDFLIFNNCLEIIKKTRSDLILVTKDQDFGISGLHPDLQCLNHSDQLIEIRDSISGINEVELKKAIQDYILKIEFNKDRFQDDDHLNRYMDELVDLLMSRELDVPLDLLLEEFDLIDSPVLINLTFMEDSWDYNGFTPIDRETVSTEFTIHAYLVYSFTIFAFDKYQLNYLPHDAQIIVKSNKNDKIALTVSSHHDLYLEVTSNLNGTEIKDVNINAIG